MTEDRCKLTEPNAMQDFAGYTRALAESHRTLGATSRTNGNSAAPIIERRLSAEKGVPSRSMNSITRKGILAVKVQVIGDAAEASEEDEDATILTKDDDYDSHVFSIQTLPSRHPSFSKRYDEQSYLLKQQLTGKLLACVECFNPSHSLPDCPYKEIDRTAEFHRWLEGNLAALDLSVQIKAS